MFKVLNHNMSHAEFISEIGSLWFLDWLIYFPLQIINFAFVKSHLLKIVNVQFIDLLIDILASMVINDGLDPITCAKDFLNSL